MFDQLRGRVGALEDHYDELKNHAELRTVTLFEVFNAQKDLAGSNHLMRNGFHWPTEPLTQAFYEIFAVSTPIGLWPEDGLPNTDVVYQLACLFIHPDTADCQYLDALGGASKMNDILGVFTASREMIKDFLDNILEVDTTEEKL